MWLKLTHRQSVNTQRGWQTLELVRIKCILLKIRRSRQSRQATKRKHLKIHSSKQICLIIIELVASRLCLVRDKCLLPWLTWTEKELCNVSQSYFTARKFSIMWTLERLLWVSSGVSFWTLRKHPVLTTEADKDFFFKCFLTNTFQWTTNSTNTRTMILRTISKFFKCQNNFQWRNFTPSLNEDITKFLDTYCNINLYVSTTVFITQGNM